MTKTHMFKALRLIASVTLLAAIVACGGSDDSTSPSITSPSTASPSGGATGTAEEGPRETRNCNAATTALGQCIEYDLAEATSEDALREQCTSLQGTLGTDPCPTEARIGTCTPNLGHTVRHYYDGDHQYVQSSASADCSMLRNGTFAASAAVAP